MSYTAVPIIGEEPLTFGGEHLALDGAEGEAFKKAVQSLHPRLLPQLKENALLSEEESAYCVAGGIFDYQRGKELVFDGEDYRLSHCAEHFVDFLLSSEECLRIVEEKRGSLANLLSGEKATGRLAVLISWWERGHRVLLLQHA